MSHRRIPGIKTRIAVAAATVTYLGVPNSAGGVMPRIMSRVSPPPHAVITPRIMTPNKSIFFRTAVIDPETANATVPIISNAKINPPKEHPFPSAFCFCASACAKYKSLAPHPRHVKPEVQIESPFHRFVRCISISDSSAKHPSCAVQRNPN